VPEQNSFSQFRSRLEAGSDTGYGGSDVARFRLCIATALALTAFIASLLRGQVNDEDSSNDKPPRKTQLKSASATPSATPKKKKSPSPRPSKTPSKSKSEPDDSATSKPKSSKTTKSPADRDDNEDTPRRPTPSPKPSKTPSATPKTKSGKKKGNAKSKSGKNTSGEKKKSSPTPEKTPKPQPTRSSAGDGATPRPAHAVAVPQPSEHPTPAPSATDTSAQLTIEKSGLEESRGLEPPPSPPPRRSWFWPWSRSRSSGQRYSYLTRSVIEEIRRAPVATNRWKFIVVHNSGTRQGNARVFDYYHRRVRRMQNGLAYHFVIGNGTSTGNGEIEVGDRWRRQINGGHVHSDFLNNIALGICLVGDFNRDQPTRAQLDSCDELIRYLRERCGKADGRSIPVRPHREMNPPRWATDCPGDAFPYPWFRKF
jgi:hypothetical protein